MASRFKEYALHGLYEALPGPEKYAVDRAVDDNNRSWLRPRCGSGVAANLVRLGLAQWAGPSTWITEWTPLGETLVQSVSGRR